MTCHSLHTRTLAILGAIIQSVIFITPMPLSAVEIEEVIVTARKREEPIKDVPNAISVFTESLIEDAGLNRPADFISLAPNVTFHVGQDQGTSVLTIRGISQIPNGETPAAIVIDGVLQNNPNTFNDELLNIRQIEILKGPQGALYGRNAIAGAININTKRPGNEFEGEMLAGAGNGDSRKYGGNLSGALIKDQLYANLSVLHKETDGYIDNVTLNRKVDFSDTDLARFRLIWEPTEHLELDLVAFYSDFEGGSSWFALTSNSNGLLGAGTTDVGNFVNPILGNNAGETERTIGDISLRASLDMSVGVVTSVTAFQTLNMDTTFDGPDYGPNNACVTFSIPLFTVDPACAAPTYFGAPFSTAFQNHDWKVFSQELRFTSPAGNRLRYIAGIYYLNTKRDLITGSNLDLGRGAVASVDFGSVVNPTRNYFSEENDNNAFAVFGQVSYDISASLEATFALRYDSDDREQFDPRPEAVRLDGLGVRVTSSRTRSETFDSLQPKFSLRYTVNEQFTVYGNVSTGFRSGGFNAPGTQTVAPEVYDEETSLNVEGGFKSRLMANRISLEGAVFYSDVDGLQVFNFDGSTNSQIIQNIDKVEIMGAELALIADVTEALQLYGNIGYADSEIQESSTNALSIGNQVPFNTRLTGSAGAQYSAPVSDTLTAKVRFDWEHRGKTYFHEGGHFSGLPARDALNLLALRGGIEAEKWSLTAWARNLTDEEYIEEVFVPDFTIQGQPRTYGVELRYRF